MSKTAINRYKKRISKTFKKVKKKILENKKLSITVMSISGVFLLSLGIFLIFKTRPNDNIFVLGSNNPALYANKNPNFEVSFGKKEEPENQWVRFESKPSAENPFGSEKPNFFQKVFHAVKPKESLGVEMSLVGMEVNETNLENLGDIEDEVKSVAEILGTEEIETSTSLVEMGREIGVYDDEQIISKETIVNESVGDGIDLEYQILAGVGVKEEIVIQSLEAFGEGCLEDSSKCKLPLNEYTFDLKLDEGVNLKSGLYTVKGKTTEAYYFENDNGEYLSHFLPSFAIDGIGMKTYDVDFVIEEIDEQNYKIVVTVDLEWLLSGERTFPIRIDPSIVHDDEADFSGGVYDNTKYDTSEIVLGSSEVVCSGGTVTTDGDDIIHTFTSDDTFECSSDINAEYLIVGGGGSGGTDVAGGGGGGGVIHKEDQYISSGAYSVTVGDGGATYNTGGNDDQGNPGGDSSFNGDTATGGGQGGGNGGSGGGGDGFVGAGSGTIGQGYDGGSGISGGSGIYWIGGGGGGAGGAGGAASSSHGGHGGIGYTSTITGSSYVYAAGGGGGYLNTNGGSTTSQTGLGGSSVGGNGGVSSNSTAIVASTAPTTYGSGGGGGGWQVGGNQAATAGYQGVVIVRYQALATNGRYTSSAIDASGNNGISAFNWIDSGINTGDGETPYSTTGLAAQWDFNETSGTTAVSGGSCGTSCNGTLNNMIISGQDDDLDSGWTYLNRKWGDGAVTLSGTNDYITVSDNNSLDMDSEVSLAVWVNFKDLSANYQTIISKRHSSSISANYALRTGTGSNSDELEFYFSSGGSWHIYTTSGADLATNHWYYIVATYDESSVEITVDAQLQGGSCTTGTCDQPLETDSNTLVFGKNGGTTEYFGGTIDNASIYSRILTSSEIESNYQSGNIEFEYRYSDDGTTWSDWEGGSKKEVVIQDNTQYSDYISSGLIRMDFEDDGQSTMTDREGNYNGTLGGGATRSSTSKVGDNSIYFDGTDDYLTLGDVAEMDAPDMFTVGMWFNRSSDNSGTANDTNHLINNTLLAQSSSSANDNLEIGTEGTKLEIYLDTNGTDINGVNGGMVEVGLANDEWHHIAVSFDYRSGTEVRIFYDGDQVYSSSSPGNLLNTSNGSPLSLGIARAGSDNWGDYNGYIDEFFISLDALTANDIKNIYNLGAGNDTVVDNTNLVTHYMLDEATGDLTGDDFEDSSGYGNHGEIEGTNLASGSVDGIHSLGRDFNGSDDYISASSADMPTGVSGDDITVAFWMNADTITGQRGILGRAGAVSDSTDWLVSIESGNVWVRTSGGNNNGTSASVAVDTWYHVVATWGVSSGHVIYINGSPGSFYTNTDTSSSAETNFSVGRVMDSGALWASAFDGSLDDVRIYDRMLSEDEIWELSRNKVVYYESMDLETASVEGYSNIEYRIASNDKDSDIGFMYGESEFANYIADANTLGLWNLEENVNNSCSGGEDVCDSSSYATHLVESSDPTSEEGFLGGGLVFDGTDDRLATSGNYTYSTSNGVTFDLWVKPEDNSARQVLLSQHKSADYGFEPFIDTDRSIWFRTSPNGSTWNDTNTGKTISWDEWSHLAFVISSSNRYLYINGSLVWSDSNGGLNVPSSWPLTLGMRAYNSLNDYYYKGVMDGVRLSNTVRSSEEIRQAYLQGIRNLEIQIEFKADLQNSNLISGSSDTSFTISETDYGTTDEIENLVIGENIIIREFLDGVEYIAQGELSAINTSTGAVEVSLWIVDSTFPTGGFTTYADVFKWETKYLNISSEFESDLDEISSILSSKGESNSVLWIDKIYASKYINDDLTNTDQQLEGYNSGSSTILHKEGTAAEVLGAALENVDISSSDLRGYTKIPFWIAIDTPGEKILATYGESGFTNYYEDSDTAELWHMEQGEFSGQVTFDGDYKIQTFSGSGTFTPSKNMDIAVLVVGGGGGGGGSNGAGGGGGAGGVVYNSSLSVTRGTTYNIEVGSGGAGSDNVGGSGINGGDSKFGTLITAVGGGGGGGYNGSSTTAPGSGGSGGGGGSSASGSFSGGTGTAGQGYAGGNGRSAGTDDQAGGGGGGAGEVGQASTTSDGGDGGDGIQNSITGTATYYGGGGAGSKRSTGAAGAAGLGGGGSTGVGTVGGNGTDGLGGGGGGGSNGQDGGDGGDGVVILRYIAPDLGYSATGTINGASMTDDGKFGGAMTFDGTDDYIEADTQLVSSYPFTLSAWVRTETTDTSDSKMAITLVDKDSEWIQYGIGLTTDNKPRIFARSTGTSTNDYYGDTAINDGEWHQIVGVFNSDTDKDLYVDSEYIGTFTTSSTYSTAVDRWSIGRFGDSTVGSYFPGDIDEVRVDSVARTEDEIRQIYEIGRRSTEIQGEFFADLDSGNLIADVNDKSFTISETDYGTDYDIENLEIGETIIIREDTYEAQGVVDSIDGSTGAVTVSAWDNGSTFPAAGYTTSAFVFKWQQEFIDLRLTSDRSSDTDAVTDITFRKLNNTDAYVWLDDIRAGEDLAYIGTPSYFQYRSIFTTTDTNLTPTLSSVTVDYLTPTVTGPTNEQLMRHGMWFNNSGEKQCFWWAGECGSGGPGTVCGNSTCEAGENASTCPGDCPASCGDGFCTHTENSVTCNADCAGSPTTYEYNMALTVDNTEVSGTSDMTDFPVLVDIQSDNLKTFANGGHVAQSTGDFKFTNTAGDTDYDFELESYDNSTGSLRAWVRIPTLQATSDTSFKIWYGNAQYVDQEDAEGVWDSNYSAVWHMNESSGTVYDSTSNNNDLSTINGSPDYSQTGVVGSSINLDGSSEYFRTSGAATTNFPTGSSAFTVQVWYNPDAATSADGWLMWGVNTTGQTNAFRRNGSTQYIHYWWGNDLVATASSISNGNWYMGAATYNGTTRRIFHNGSQVGSHNPSAPNVQSGGLYVGKTANSEYWDGKIDEIRVSKTDRGGDWLATEYNNQNSPGTFISVGEEQ